MRIGIIGAGNIGSTLTRRLTALGHEVVVANSRGPQTLEDLAEETGATAALAAVAAEGAELVIEGTREADLPELRGAVDGFERKPAPAGLRGERDDVAGASLHVRQRGAHRVQRALQVDVDHLVEVFE